MEIRRPSPNLNGNVDAVRTPITRYQVIDRKVRTRRTNILPTRSTQALQHRRFQGCMMRENETVPLQGMSISSAGLG